MALWAVIAVLQLLAAVRMDGHLVYTLDDAYIHMAMAKNLALHDVYGVTRYEFSSSSSSPVWTLLVALFYVIFGVHDAIPFLLNLVVASLVLVTAYALLTKFVKSIILLITALLCIAFFTPLPLLVSTGMEHTLHILLAMLFLWLATRALIEDFSTLRTWAFVALLVVCAGLVMTRLESYALVVVMVVLFFIRGRWKVAIGVLLASVIPLFVYQAISVAHGWEWLPNSILIRAHIEHAQMFNSLQAIVVDPGGTPGSVGFLTAGLRTIVEAPYFAVLIGASLLLLIFSVRRTRQFWRYEHVMLAAYIVMAFAQAQFGRTGQFYRYEAYVIALGIFVLTPCIESSWAALRLWMTKDRTQLVAGLAFLLIALQMMIPLFTRCFVTLPLIPQASKNIYEQQYQMGLFLQRYYGGKTVAANDIGAICYLADIHLVDLVGLGSADIYQLRRHNLFTTERVQQLCNERGVALAVAYELWLQFGGMPDFQRKWKVMGRWRILDDAVFECEIVSFLAVNPNGAQQLRTHLVEFSKVLPLDVGYWISPDVGGNKP